VRPNIVLLVVDSLRHDAVFDRPPDRPGLGFFERLAAESICFTRAYATECWTLPTHMSMFTGLLPSAHGAHFASMAYRHAARRSPSSSPTVGTPPRSSPGTLLSTARCPA
jgi:arylsulfatase A-like enzyme